MVAAEWWTFEAVILMAGLLPNPSLAVAVMGICINTGGAFYMLVSAVAMSLSVRVGTCLGAGCPKTARRATRAALLLGCTLEALLIAVILVFRSSWALLFTGDVDDP